jgi:hypothetical protein
MATLREAILAKDDRPRKPVEVPEWGTTVYVARLSAGDRVALAKLARDEAIDLADYVLIFACDEHGVKLFSADDREALSSKSYEALERIVSAGMDFNGMGPDAIDEAKND